MDDSTLDYEVPPEAVRVFCGFPQAGTSQADFFAKLGQTFMPGTPYMLRPLGLAAYLPGVLASPPGGLPHEFALICYPSPAVWNAGMNETLRGRVYSQSHGGVYDLARSGAAFPVYVEQVPPATPAATGDQFYLFPGSFDWQLGSTRVAIAARRDPQQSGDAFRTAVREALAAGRPDLAAQGFVNAGREVQRPPVEKCSAEMGAYPPGAGWRGRVEGPIQPSSESAGSRRAARPARRLASRRR